MFKSVWINSRIYDRYSQVIHIVVTDALWRSTLEYRSSGQHAGNSAHASLFTLHIHWFYHHHLSPRFNALDAFLTSSALNEKGIQRKLFLREQCHGRVWRDSDVRLRTRSETAGRITEGTPPRYCKIPRTVSLYRSAAQLKKVRRRPLRNCVVTVHVPYDHNGVFLVITARFCVTTAGAFRVVRKVIPYGRATLWTKRVAWMSRVKRGLAVL